MKYCVNCGKQIADEAAFCVNCGKAADKLPAEGKAKYCAHCGAALGEGADYCISCGCRVACAPKEEERPSKDDLGTAAKVFMVLGCVGAGLAAVALIVLASITTYISVAAASVGNTNWAYGWLPITIYRWLPITIYLWACGIGLLISLAWCIPLTVYVFRCIKNGRAISTAAKVCILIFVNTISGILLLCRKEPNK